VDADPGADRAPGPALGAQGLRLRLVSIAGRLAVTGRHRLPHLAATASFTDLLLDRLRRLDALAVPG
jgi:hypothetical protein